MVAAGWVVTTGQRGQRPVADEPGIRRVRLDRYRPGELEGALEGGADVFIDVIAYDAEDAEQLLSIAGAVGSLIVVSSASVYRDEEGRTIDEATDEETFPDFPLPITEEQATVEPGEATYSRRKRAMEATLLERSPVSLTIVRPCAIHGPGTQHAREWYFLKRALDGRQVIFHAFRGGSVFHTTSVQNLAELIRLASEQPGTRVLNCGDPHPPTVRRIARAIWDTVSGQAPTEVLIAGASPLPDVGESPWTAPRSMVLDMSQPTAALGYEPVTGYEQAVRETCAWLARATKGQDWKRLLPDLARYPGDLFNYAAEDEFLRRLSEHP